MRLEREHAERADGRTTEDDSQTRSTVDRDLRVSRRLGADAFCRLRSREDGRVDDRLVRVVVLDRARWDVGRATVGLLDT